METRQATKLKWAPKKTPQNELREAKRPVNNRNNILSGKIGALWYFNQFFPLLLCFFAAFLRNMWWFSIALLTETKRAVSWSWILLLHSVLILIWSDSPRSLRHLRGHRQDCSSCHWHNNQGPMQPKERWFKTKVANAVLKENHLKCYAGKFIYILCAPWS